MAVLEAERPITHPMRSAASRTLDVNDLARELRGDVLRGEARGVEPLRQKIGGEAESLYVTFAQLHGAVQEHFRRAQLSGGFTQEQLNTISPAVKTFLGFTVEP